MDEVQIQELLDKLENLENRILTLEDKVDELEDKNSKSFPEGLRR